MLKLKKKEDIHSSGIYILSSNAIGHFTLTHIKKKENRSVANLKINK